MPIKKIQKLIKALRNRQLTNFLEAAEAIGYHGEDAISLLIGLQSGEVAS